MDDVMKLDIRSEREDLERVSHKLNNDAARAQGGEQPSSRDLSTPQAPQTL